MGEWEPKGILDDEDVRMRLRIMHAVDKSLDQIKVTDLCEKIGISRQMFYRYFDSKYSLHWWWPMHVHKFYLIEVGRTMDWETGYFHHLKLLSQRSIRSTSQASAVSCLTIASAHCSRRCRITSI